MSGIGFDSVHGLSVYSMPTLPCDILYMYFLARRDECPESYCRTPGVGIRVRLRMYKNYNLAYNS